LDDFLDMSNTRGFPALINPSSPRSNYTFQDFDSATPFLKWFQTEYKTHATQKYAGGFGIGLSFISCFSAFKLGQGFGGIVGTLLGANEEATTFLQILFGTAAFIPTGTLVSFPVYGEFKHSTGYIMCLPQLTRRPDFNRTLAPMLSARALAALAGIPFYYLMSPYLNDIPVVKILFPGTALVTGYLATFAIERMIIENIFIHLSADSETNVSKDARALLNGKASRAITALKHTSNDDVEMIWQKICALTVNNAFSEADNIDIIQILLDEVPTLFDNSDQQNALALMHSSWVYTSTRYTTDIVSILLGIFATYVLFALAKSGTELLLQTVGVDDFDDAMIQDLITTIAVFSTLPNTIFGAYFAFLAGRSIHESAAELKCCPSVQTSSAYIIAAFSAVPQTYVAITAAESTFDKAIIIPTFCGTTLARALAFNMLLSVITHVLYPESVGRKRSELIHLITRLQRGINLGDPSQIVAIRDALIVQPSTPPGENIVSDSFSVVELARDSSAVGLSQFGQFNDRRRASTRVASPEPSNGATQRNIPS
jgi:hypothetical protein